MARGGGGTGGPALRIGRNAAAGAVRRWRDSRFSPRLRFDPAAAERLLAPHLDDAVFNCRGLLTSTRRVRVRGRTGAGLRNPLGRICGPRDSNQMARIRLEEDHPGVGLAGRSAVNLDLLEIESRRGAPRRALA
jgi:hypothetical protein